MIIIDNHFNLGFVDFVVPADNKMEVKESKKRDKYLDLRRELKKNYRT